MYARDIAVRMRALAVLTLISPCLGFTITKVTHAVPTIEDRSARDGKISGDGLWVAFQSDSDFAETGLAGHADEAHHVWMKDLEGDGFNLLSSDDKPSDKDAKRVSLDHTGAHACFDSEISGLASIMKWTKEGNVLKSFVSLPNAKTDDPGTSLHSPDGKRDALYCNIAADGKCIVFETDAHIADLNETHKCNPSAEKKGCVEVDYRKDQIYLTCDDGASFTMVTPKTATSTKSEGASVNADGKFVSFRSKGELIEGVTVSGKDEAYLYEVATGLLEKVTNLEPACDTDVIYAKLVELHTEEKLTELKITRGSVSSCNYYVKEGLFSAIASVGVGAAPSMSDSGRFLSYTTNFDAADTHGTHAGKLMASFAHLFLFDAQLGVTWQVTNEGVAGAEYDQWVEAFCCPGASSSKQRGSCSEKTEAQFQCCWQKPCGTPALNSYTSGDGNSIVFFGDHDHTGAKDSVWKDLDIYHYYIPTSTFTRISKTNNSDHDDVFPSVSYNGDRVVWTSKFDYPKNAPLPDTTQIMLAELSMGCSGSAAATNFLEAPDVETCCTWSSEIKPYSAGEAVVNVVLTLNLDQEGMIERIPFKSAAEVDRAAFCGRVAETVKDDIACALNIPPMLITVNTGDAACGWASDFEKKVTVELTLHKKCTGSAGGLADPVDLAASIVSQHADPSSRLWRGYLTKTLVNDVAPAVTEVAADGEASCPGVDLGGEDEDAGDSSEDADGESSSDRYLLSISVLAAILL